MFEYSNRNKIIAPDGSWTRISVPIKKGHKFKSQTDTEEEEAKDMTPTEAIVHLLSKV